MQIRRAGLSMDESIQFSAAAEAGARAQRDVDNTHAELGYSRRMSSGPQRSSNLYTNHRRSNRQFSGAPIAPLPHVTCWVELPIDCHQSHNIRHNNTSIRMHQRPHRSPSRTASTASNDGRPRNRHHKNSRTAPSIISTIIQ